MQHEQKLLAYHTDSFLFVFLTLYATLYGETSERLWESIERNKRPDKSGQPGGSSHKHKNCEWICLGSPVPRSRPGRQQHMGR